MVEAIKPHSAAAALAGRWPKSVHAIHFAADTPLSVNAEPASTRQFVLTGHGAGPIGPVAARGKPGPVVHLVAIGGEQHRPGMARLAKDDDTTHLLYRRV